MKHLVELAMENMSTGDYFLFRTICCECGTAYGNRPIRFSKAGAAPPSESRKRLYEALYDQELRSARQSAVREAAENLNYCPVCKRLVCNRCFLICRELDMCKRCADELEETGSPVISHQILSV